MSGAEGTPGPGQRHGDRQDTALAPGTEAIPTERLRSFQARDEATPHVLLDGPDVEAGAEILAQAERRGEKLGLLGKGGCGEVWRVRYLNSEEAWKFLPKRPGGDLDALIETVNARSVDHPNIVRVQDIAEDAQHYILRMDLVRGRDLFRIVTERGVLPPGTACRYVLQVAGALEAAHGHGVLHLDLKPSNLILREDGETVMITDFGISLALEGDKVPGGARPGVGTPCFLAPEQILSEGEIGPWTDIWALGITLYYLITRAYPFVFKGEDVSVILTESPRPLPDVVPYVSKELWSLVRKMLEREPKDRFQSMGEVRKALSEYLEMVACPACHHRARLSRAAERCPRKGCSDPKRLASYHAARGLLRAAEDSFARAELEEVGVLCGKLLETCRSRQPEIRSARKEARRLAGEAEKSREALAKSVAAVRKGLLEDDLLAAIVAVDGARRRFSAAAELLRLRGEILDAIRARHHSLEDRAAALLEKAEFDAAKRAVAEVRAFLDHPPVARELVEGDAVPSGPLSGDVNDLVELIDRRETLYAAAREDLAASLDRLDLEAAAAALQRLQNHFPDPANLEQIRLYSDLQESLQAIGAHDLEVTCEKLEAEGEQMSPALTELAEVRRHADHVLEHLDPEEIPALSRVVEFRSRVEKLVELLKRQRRELEGRLQAAQKNGRSRDELDVLDELLRLDVDGLVYDSAEAASHRERHAQLARLVDQADRKLREGQALHAKGDYAGALLLFEAAQTIAPGAHADLPESIARCRELIEEHRVAEVRLEEMFELVESDEIRGTDADLEHFHTFLVLARRVRETRGRTGAGELYRKTDKVLGRLLRLRAAVLERERAGASRVRLLATTLDTVLEVAPEELERMAGDPNGAFPEALFEFASVFLRPLEEPLGPEAGLEERLAAVSDGIGQLGRLGPALRRLRGPASEPHPVVRASKALLGLTKAVSERADAASVLGGGIGAHRALYGLAGDPAMLLEIDSHHGVLQRARQAALLRDGAHRLLSWSLAAVVPVLAAAVAGLIAYTHHRAVLAEHRLDLARSLVAPLLGASSPAGEAGMPELPSELRERLLGGEHGLASFLRQMGIGAAERDPPPSASDHVAYTTDRLSSRLGGLRQKALFLETLLATDTSEGAVSWNVAVKRAEQGVARDVEREVHEYLDARFAASASAALVVDPFGDPLAPLRQLRDDLDLVLRLGTEATSPFRREPLIGPVLPQVRAWRTWTRELLARLERTGAAPSGDASGHVISHPGHDGLLLVGHAVYVAALAHELVGESQAMYWGGQSPEGLEAILHARIVELLEYRERVLDAAPPGGPLERLRALRFSSPSGASSEDDAIGHAVRALVREILAAGH